MGRTRSPTCRRSPAGLGPGQAGPRRGYRDTHCFSGFTGGVPLDRGQHQQQILRPRQRPQVCREIPIDDVDDGKAGEGYSFGGLGVLTAAANPAAPGNADGIEPGCGRSSPL